MTFTERYKCWRNYRDGPCRVGFKHYAMHPRDALLALRFDTEDTLD